ncbi:MAG: pantetheine-phosphate adenylyltransferase [bacterium]
MPDIKRHCRHAAIYPGTFDPFTLGHEDLVRRAALIFDRLTVAVVSHSRKRTMFTLEERMQMTQETLRDIPNVVVKKFDGLLVDYVHSLNAHVIVRGLRAFSDFEYEFQMALTNRALAPDIETLFLMPQEQYSYISSSTVREVMDAGAEMMRFVPKPVLHYIEAKRKAAGGREPNPEAGK